eukprot:SAG31_NODE_1411_length_8466_cov_18.216565_2_plen_110_part_00
MTEVAALVDRFFSAWFGVTVADAIGLAATEASFGGSGESALDDASLVETNEGDVELGEPKNGGATRGGGRGPETNGAAILCLCIGDIGGYESCLLGHGGVAWATQMVRA